MLSKGVLDNPPKPFDRLIDEAVREIDRAVLTLITFNHRDAWEYDWETLVMACEVVQEVQKTFTVTIASGLCLPFAGEKEQDKFLKG